MNNEIFVRLKSALKNYGENVEIADGLLFNQKETINQITLYSSSKFKNGDKDSMGNKMYFFNIGNDACFNSTKNIQVDSKHIRVHSVDGTDRIKAMIYTEKLRRYMEDNGIGLLLNQLAESLPKYGSVIWKKMDNKSIRQINLSNIIIDPAVSNLPQDFTIRSSYVIEKHYLQPYELEKMASKGWDKQAVKRVIDAFRKLRDSGQNISDILIYEMHAELPNSYFSEGAEGYSYYRIYLTSFDSDKRMKTDQPVEEVLYHNKEKELPYKKVDYQTIDGRNLGKGIWEELFDTQIRLNTMKNEKALAMAIGSKVIFATTDETIERNILKDLMNGDILKVRGTVTPLNVNMQNVGLYANEEASWISNGRGLTNKFEAMTGESMPTNTPYKSLARLNEEGTKYFAFIRQNIGLFLKDVFKNWVIPEFEANMDIGEVLEISSKEVVQALQERYIENKLQESIKDVIINYGIFPSQQDIDVAREQMKQQFGKKVLVKINEDLKYFDKNLFIDVTGENYADNLENKINLIRDLSQNSQALQNPTISKLYDSASEDMGISPNLLTL